MANALRRRPPTQHTAAVCGSPGKHFWATTGRSAGGRDGHKLQMPPDPRAHRRVGDGGQAPATPAQLTGNPSGCCHSTPARPPPGGGELGELGEL
jgi:hypothetical protein